MNDARHRLEAAAASLQLHLSPAAFDQFDRYVNEILRWRGRLNLISAGSARAIVDRHIVDSLLPLAAIEIPEGSRLIDVGSGAGFPGVPMRIARPDLVLTLVEASRRRVAFLEHLRQSLGLADVAIEWGRAEVLGHREAFRERFGIATERAAARMASAAELCLPFVIVGGIAVLLKGPSAVAEVGGAAALIAALGGTVDRLERRALPGTDQVHVLALIRKVSLTPEAYPRHAGRLGLSP